MSTPYRQIRAAYTEEVVTVYQAYEPRIADAALAAGRFVPPFKRERMTWIKPSFLWMMYRCGWAGKPGQERVLAIDITREGLSWALSHACLSHYDPRVHSGQAAWRARLRESPVRVQWDPERDVHLRPLPYRSIQIGLSGEAVHRYVGEWTTGIRDVTDTAHAVRRAVRDGDAAAIAALLPAERPYPHPPGLPEIFGPDTAAPSPPA
ncbi:DUF4291 domain-containing protein [Bailinhaonella thermotolerans]|uniref:DUF4291 domain-containing protein n=1 Tax=Bailinhaonella thermotolerans TaxID=1070861 RepID=A0A3A4A581_9ACTN|nr:DUF4291 domain-containing protein [Bailinhaonella thermotolerans]RJL20782.1 DUF4291 domain-containing protein [Bailinhaonella thermotolerans]